MTWAAILSALLAIAKAALDVYLTDQERRRIDKAANDAIRQIELHRREELAKAADAVRRARADAKRLHYERGGGVDESDPFLRD